MTRVSRVPRPHVWWAWLALVSAIVLTPWIVYLRLTLPRTYLVTRWDLAWLGFDVLLLAAFLATAWTAWARRPAFVVVAAATGTMLLVDGWFDTMMASEPGDQNDSLLALALELPLGIVLLTAAGFSLRELLRRARTSSTPG